MKLLKLDCIIAGAVSAFITLNMNCETVYDKFAVGIYRCENEESICYLAAGTTKGIQCYFKKLSTEENK